MKLYTLILAVIISGCISSTPNPGDSDDVLTTRESAGYDLFHNGTHVITLNATLDASQEIWRVTMGGHWNDTAWTNYVFDPVIDSVQINYDPSLSQVVQFDYGRATVVPFGERTIAEIPRPFGDRTDGNAISPERFMPISLAHATLDTMGPEGVKQWSVTCTSYCWKSAGKDWNVTLTMDNGLLPASMKWRDSNGATVDLIRTKHSSSGAPLDLPTWSTPSFVPVTADTCGWLPCTPPEWPIGLHLDYALAAALRSLEYLQWAEVHGDGALVFASAGQGNASVLGQALAAQGGWQYFFVAADGSRLQLILIAATDTGGRVGSPAIVFFAEEGTWGDARPVQAAGNRPGSMTGALAEARLQYDDETLMPMIVGWFLLPEGDALEPYDTQVQFFWDFDVDYPNVYSYPAIDRVFQFNS